MIIPCGDVKKKTITFRGKKCIGNIGFSRSDGTP
jgi:hypothetical protein